MMQDKNWKFDENMFPVIKFDLNNRLTYANVAALPLMKEWNCRINEKLPSELVSRHPELFHAGISHLDQDLTIEVGDYMMHFSLVPFPEAGYIGMYGYCIEQVENYVPRNTPLTEKVKVSTDK